MSKNYLSIQEIADALEFCDIPSNEEDSEAGCDSDDTDDGVNVDHDSSIGTIGELLPNLEVDQPHSNTQTSSCNHKTQAYERQSKSLPKDRAPVSNSLNQIIPNNNSVFPIDYNSDETDNECESDIFGWGEDTNWFENSTVPPFDQDVVHNFSITDTALNFLTRFLTSDIIPEIITQTNLYAQQKHTNNWIPVTLTDMAGFLGILIQMGIHILPSMKHYWSSNPLLGVPSIQKVMSLKRFQAILANLHCNDNTNCPKKSEPGYDKLYKLRPLIDYVNEKFHSELCPSSFQSIDESMIAFKGRSAFKQYMPMKPIKRGYKVWARADAGTGYICQLEVYTRKSEINCTGEQSLGEKVVLHLTNKINQSLCLVTFDNFFTSVNLMEELFYNGIYACGTVRVNRKELPCVMKKTNKLQRGEYLWKTRDALTAIQWQDNRVVNLLSTAHDPLHMTQVNRTQKDGQNKMVSCPLAVREYNAHMGGVDKSDQLRQCYEIAKKSRKWWIKIFYYIIDVSIVNSFILYNLTRRKFDKNEITHLDYRLRLINLLTSGSSRKKKGPIPLFVMNKAKKQVPEEVRLSGVGKHLPVAGTTYRRCKYCSTKAKEKRSKIICSSCSVPLCGTSCFTKFHTCRDFPQ